MSASAGIDLAIARKVLETEAAAILALVERVDERFERAVRILIECRGRAIVTGMGTELEARFAELPRTAVWDAIVSANRSVGESSQFNLRRARLLFTGHLINPDFKYFIQLGMESSENAQTPGSVNLLDFYFTSTHFPLLNAQLGQYKVYFNRSQINNTASMQFAERALVQDAFTANGLTLDQLTGPGMQRLPRIRELLEQHALDEDLRWRVSDPQPA